MTLRHEDIDGSVTDATASLLDQLPDAVLVLDTIGSVLWGNVAAERLFGRGLAESVGLSAIDLVHPDDLSLAQRSLASVQGKDVGSPIELRVPGAAGWRLVEVLGTPVTWFGRRAVLFSLRDLTERRRFEIAHHDEARFRSLLQGGAAIVLLLSPAGLIESISAAVSRLLGHDPELLEHRPLADLVDTPDRPALVAALDRASRSPAAEPVTVALRLVRYASSETVPFDLSIVNLVDDPTVGGYVVSAHDISARSETERELREALSLLRATLDATADGILVVGVDGEIGGFNRHFAEMLCLRDGPQPGGDPVTATEQVMAQLTGARAMTPGLGGAPSGRGPVGGDVLEMADGRIFERRWRPQLVDGAVVGAVWSFRDVTESRRLVEELREREEQFRLLFNLTKRRSLENELVAHAHTARQLLGRLSARETEVLQLLATTDSAPEMADELCVSVRTVESHLSSAYRKLGVRSRQAAQLEFARLSRTAAGLDGVLVDSVPGT